MLIATVCGFAIAFTLEAVRSLAVSESMVAWTKVEDKPSHNSRRPNRVEDLAKIWSNDVALLKENPTAMRSFADGLIFEYRNNQLIANPSTLDWNNTSPILFRLALEREQSQKIKDQIIESVGGTKAISLLDRSANWYALGQTKSPLDWRLLWGRCLANTVCERNELAKLLPASLALGKHNAQQLLAKVILFRDQFEQDQFEQVLSQAMKTDPGTALNSAKLVSLEKSDKSISIAIFPQRFDILMKIANDAFTKDLFPQTNQLLWERVKELILLEPMTISSKEILLAKASIALGDVSGEISHLREAAKGEPNNIILQCQLAKRLVDAGEIDGARIVLSRILRLDPGNSDAKALQKRINEI